MRTFVVRLWTGGDDLASGSFPLRGVLEEVATGEATRFTRGEELLGALERAAKQATEPQSHGSAPDRPDTDSAS